MLRNWLSDLTGLQGLSAKAAWKHIAIVSLIVVSLIYYQIVALMFIFSASDWDFDIR